jgi:hypothetical protein
VEGSIQGLNLKEFFLLLSSTGLAYRRCELVRVNGTEMDIRFLRGKHAKKRPGAAPKARRRRTKAARFVPPDAPRVAPGPVSIPSPQIVRAVQRMPMTFSCEPARPATRFR